MSIALPNWGTVGDQRIKFTSGDLRHHISIFFQRVAEDRIFRLAAALAYSSALSLAPLMLLILALLSSFSLDLQQV